MQDIDFDELDRAVNSVTKPTAASSPDSESTSVPVSRPKPTVAATPPAVRRSSGRFMDVVHPSSDMRGASVPERSAPRDVPVKPTFEETLVSKPAAPTPAEIPEPAPIVNAPSTDWPDPLDFQGFSLEETPVMPSPTPPPKPVAPKPETPAEPLESPFLSDAKVEKRPLGAFSSTDEPTSSDDKEPEETPLLEAPDEVELLEAENEITPPKPVEETPEVKSEPEPAPQPVEDIPQGPTSITQQYKEQPSTVEQTSGAIYDTESYHQPLVHAPKKKSGVLVVVWIAALILVGAGAGAAVYFFVLPLL